VNNGYEADDHLEIVDVPWPVMIFFTSVQERKMNISISDRHQTLAQKQAIAAGFANICEYIETMIEQVEIQAEEEAETIASVREGLADVAAGRVRPYRTALADLARKYNFPQTPEN
jgi:predicted transcriptional regulator